MIKKTIVLLLIFICFCPVGSASSARVVSLSPAITEIIFALAAEDQLVGVSSYCDYPPQAKEITDVGGFINPNMEKIIMQKPDVVILSPNSGTKMIQESLDRIGIETKVVSFYTIETLFSAYTKIGTIVGKEAAAKRLGEELAVTIQDIEEKTWRAVRPTVLFVREHTPLYVTGAGTYEDDLIRIVGGENSVQDGKPRYPQYTIESVIALDPEIIIDAAYYETPTVRQKKELRAFWTRLKMIKAVKNKKVFIIKTDIHSVPGPRTTVLLRLLSRLIHPEIFGEETEYSENVLL